MYSYDTVRKALALQESDIRPMLDYLLKMGTAPTGLNAAYLWEAARFRFIDVLYSDSAAFGDVIYAYEIRDGVVLEEWAATNEFRDFLDACISERAATERVFAALESPALGSSRGWRQTDKSLEMRMPVPSRPQGARQAISCTDEHREMISRLMSEEWWTEDQATNFADVVLGNPQGISKIVVHEDEAKAFAHAMRDSNRAWINAVYVSGVARGQGFGEEVCRAILSELAEQGVAEVFLGVSESNTGAIRMYERLGFRFTSFVRWEFGTVRGVSSEFPAT